MTTHAPDVDDLILRVHSAARADGGSDSVIRELRLAFSAYRSAVDALTSAVFGVDSTGRVVFVNQAGEELACNGRWVQVLDGFVHPAADLQEKEAFSRALHQVAKGLSFHFVVMESATRTQAIVSGAPASTAIESRPPMAAAALIWVTPIVPNPDAAADLARLFELTPAERRLVARLIAGEALSEAASHLGISLHTARTQLKAIYRKTGRRTQAALLTLAGRLAVLRTPHP